MKILIILLFIFSSITVYADTTPNGEIQPLSKGQIVPYDGYLLDKRLIEHTMTLNEERKVLEKEVIVLKDEVRLDEIQKQEAKEKEDALQQKIEQEKAGKVVLGIVAFGLGIFTGGVFAIILHLIP
jgi:hypothetical protein